MHRKCSEQRPSCEYCSSTGKQCSYDKVLKWGGRSFKKSCFGQVLSTGAVIKQSEERSGSNGEEWGRVQDVRCADVNSQLLTSSPLSMAQALMILQRAQPFWQRRILHRSRDFQF